MAERLGFELPVQLLTVQRFSKTRIYTSSNLESIVYSHNKSRYSGQIMRFGTRVITQVITPEKVEGVRIRHSAISRALPVPSINPST
jgi:hypothetical protein